MGFVEASPQATDACPFGGVGDALVFVANAMSVVAAGRLYPSAGRFFTASPVNPYLDTPPNPLRDLPNPQSARISGRVWTCPTSPTAAGVRWSPDAPGSAAGGRRSCP